MDMTLAAAYDLILDHIIDTSNHHKTVNGEVF